MTIRRFERYETEGFLESYIHLGGKLGVMLDMAGEATDAAKEAAHDVTLQIAFTKPAYLTKEEVSEETLAKEKEVLKQQAMNEGKPQAVAEKIGAKEGDLILILSGDKKKMQGALGTLRLEMGNRLGLRDPFNFAPLWVVDFPLVEWDDETQRFYAMHHPFTAPKPEHLELFYSDKKEDLEKVCANAYDFVLNGTELGGGSIRIHEAAMQERMFEVLGISKEDAEYKFGFIINAFKFGAPPHGGLAFGFDRVCSLFGGQETIRDYIAFPKNNQGRDVMIDSPSYIDQEQMDELFLESKAERKE